MAMVASDARSEASGAGSARSNGSRNKYRVVSRGSNVDESLFGSSNGKGRKNSSGRRVVTGEVSRFYLQRLACIGCGVQQEEISVPPRRQPDLLACRTKRAVYSTIITHSASHVRSTDWHE